MAAWVFISHRAPEQGDFLDDENRIFTLHHFLLVSFENVHILYLAENPHILQNCGPFHVNWNYCQL